jgi:hypothetical protein
VENEGRSVELGRTFEALVRPHFHELHCSSHCSYKEISQRLRIPLGTVGTRLLRARRKLRSLLDDAAPA